MGYGDIGNFGMETWLWNWGYVSRISGISFLWVMVRVTDWTGWVAVKFHSHKESIKLPSFFKCHLFIMSFHLPASNIKSEVSISPTHALSPPLLSALPAPDEPPSNISRNRALHPCSLLRWVDSRNRSRRHHPCRYSTTSLPPGSSLTWACSRTLIE